MHDALTRGREHVRPPPGGVPSPIPASNLQFAVYNSQFAVCDSQPEPEPSAPPMTPSASARLTPSGLPHERWARPDAMRRCRRKLQPTPPCQSLPRQPMSSFLPFPDKTTAHPSPHLRPRPKMPSQVTEYQAVTPANRRHLARTGRDYTRLYSLAASRIASRLARDADRGIAHPEPSVNAPCSA